MKMSHQRTRTHTVYSEIKPYQTIWDFVLTVQIIILSCPLTQYIYIYVSVIDCSLVATACMLGFVV